MSVTNRYHGPPAGSPGTGSGSLIDRAHTVGGTVAMWQDGGRYHLAATLPLLVAQSEVAAS